MKKLKLDSAKGEAKLSVESLDDLWYLGQIIDVGDLVRARTLRKIKIGGEGDRKQGVSRKPVTLQILIEKIEPTSDSLRLLGTIEEGPEDVVKGDHHTITLEIGTTFTLNKKQWLSYQIERVEEASANTVSKILILVMDREEAIFALLKKYGYDVLSSIKGKVNKKAVDEKTESTFYKELVKKLDDYNKRHSLVTLVIASPAFWKEELMKIMPDELRKKVILATCNDVSKNGIDEVLRRPEVVAALKADRITKEISEVEKLLTEISKDGAAAYGLDDVVNACNAGACQTLLLTDSFLTKSRDGDFSVVENLMRTADSLKCKIHIISSEHEGGKKLDGLGGVGSVLRYQLNY